MEFTTQVKVEPFDRKIDHTMSGLSVGSCFAGNVAAKMKRAKLPVTHNPFGVLFNPASIADSLDALHAGRRYTADDLVREGDKWSSFAFHGSFSSTDPGTALAAMNRAAADGELALRNADYVIVTFGTAWVFELAAGMEGTEYMESAEHKQGRPITSGAQAAGGSGAEGVQGGRGTKDGEVVPDAESVQWVRGTQSTQSAESAPVAARETIGTPKTESAPEATNSAAGCAAPEATNCAAPRASQRATVVANCHRFPAKTFVRRRLTVAEIVERYDALFDTALRGRHVIFTVSPVRHLKDGAAENALSKAILLEAVHELVARHSSAGYFPAFEILNDELRDYRFYADDMVHPSAVAIEYIWEKFRRAALTPRAADAAKEVEKIAAAMEHRPPDPTTAAHGEFLAGMSARVAELAARYPEIDFTAEAEYFLTRTKS